MNSEFEARRAQAQRLAVVIGAMLLAVVIVVAVVVKSQTHSWGWVIVSVGLVGLCAMVFGMVGFVLLEGMRGLRLVFGRGRSRSEDE